MQALDVGDDNIRWEEGNMSEEDVLRCIVAPHTCSVNPQKRSRADQEDAIQPSPIPTLHSSNSIFMPTN